MTEPLTAPPGFDRDDVPVLIRRDGAYVLAEALRYRGSKGDVIVVPQGFVTDLASVPRFLTALTPIAGVHNRAAILHDVLCVRLAVAYNTPGRVPQINAVDTDGLFRQCLRLLGVPPFRRTLYWVGVRWGAAANKARRPGWWSNWTGLRVLAWSLLLLPLVGPAAIVTGLTLGIGKLAALALTPLRNEAKERPPVAEHTRKALAARRKP